MRAHSGTNSWKLKLMTQRKQKTDKARQQGRSVDTFNKPLAGKPLLHGATLVNRNMAGLMDIRSQRELSAPPTPSRQRNNCAKYNGIKIPQQNETVATLRQYSFQFVISTQMIRLCIPYIIRSFNDNLHII